MPSFDRNTFKTDIQFPLSRQGAADLLGELEGFRVDDKLLAQIHRSLAATNPADRDTLNDRRGAIMAQRAR